MPVFVSRPAALSLAAVLAFCLAGPADAQSFLKNLARQAAAAAIQNAAAGSASQQPPEQAAVASNDGDGGAATEAAEAAPAARASTGPAPWPQNLGERGVTSPSRLTFSADLEAQKKAFLEFSKVPCNDCEGGYSFDAWGQHFIRLDASWKAWEKKLGALAVGESLSWQGRKSKAAITVVSEEPVGAWPCKQLQWTLTRPDAKAERPGLICNARPDGNPDWTIAF